MGGGMDRWAVVNRFGQDTAIVTGQATARRLARALNRPAAGSVPVVVVGMRNGCMDVDRKDAGCRVVLADYDDEDGGRQRRDGRAAIERYGVGEVVKPE